MWISVENGWDACSTVHQVLSKGERVTALGPLLNIICRGPAQTPRKSLVSDDSALLFVLWSLYVEANFKY